MPDPKVWEDIRRAYADPSISLPTLCTTFSLTPTQLRKLRTDGNWPVRLDAATAARIRKAARAAALPDPVSDSDSASANLPSPQPAATPEPAPDIVAPAIPPQSSQPTTDETPAFGPPVRSPPKRRHKPTPIAQRRALVTRLYTAIDTKLKLLERRFAHELASTDKAISASDTERDTRAIGTLIKNLEQVTEYDHGQEPGKSLRGAAAKSATLAATALADEADRLRRELAERLSRLVETTRDPSEAGPEGN